MSTTQQSIIAVHCYSAWEPVPCFVCRPRLMPPRAVYASIAVQAFIPSRACDAVYSFVRVRSMYDVAWRPSGGHVAASLSNGGVAMWNLQHLSSSSSSSPSQSWAGQGQPQEETGSIIGTHDRSVNRLSWNPFDHNMLLSGSQARRRREGVRAAMRVRGDATEFDWFRENNKIVPFFTHPHPTRMAVRAKYISSCPTRTAHLRSRFFWSGATLVREQ